MKNAAGRIAVTLLALAGFLTVSSLLAQERTGIIRGRITDSLTGAPLSGVRVMGLSPFGAGTAITAADGTYSLEGLIPGMYRLRAYVLPSYPGHGYVEQYYSEKYYLETADSVKAANGEITSGIDFALAPGAAITGRLTDAETGAPIAGVRVVTYTLGEQALGNASSGSGGEFTISRLRDGYYKLYAWTQAYNNTHPDCFEDLYYPLSEDFWGGSVITVATGQNYSLPADWELPYCRITPTPSGPTPTPVPPPLQIFQVWAGVPGDSGDGVGQATLVITPEDKVWLFDCGDKSNFGVLEKSCPREVLYLLDSLGYDRIDYAVVSHFDADHCYGFITIANGTGDPADLPLVRDGVGQIPVAYDRGGTQDVDGSALSVFYTAGVASRLVPALGADINLGYGARLRWLALGNANPVSPGDQDKVFVLGRPALTGTIDENAKSIVAAIIYGGFDYYIGGDSTSSSLSSYVGVEEAVSDVYRNEINRSFDLLLLDHHGSRFHSPSVFLQRTLPEAALASVWNNSYGHPNCETLERVIQYTETGPGRKSVFQVSRGSSDPFPCNQYVLATEAPIRIHTDGYYYSIEPRIDLAPYYYSVGLPLDRYTALNPIADLAWRDHPVDGLPFPSPTPAPTPPVQGSVVISEVCWAGTQASYYDEWIELYNRTNYPVDISSWSIKSPKYSYDFSGAIGTLIIPPKGYWVFSSKNDIFSAGAVVNAIGSLTLLNSEVGQFRLYNEPEGTGILVDAVNPAPDDSNWCAGISSAANNRRTMERRNPGFDGTVCANWCTYDGVPFAADRGGYPILGSPGEVSSCHVVTPTPSVSPVKTATPTRTPFGYKTPPPTATPSPLPATVVINEIAWSGTAAGGQFEWLELYNATDAPVNLTDWFLEIGSLSLDLTGTIGAKGYYLIERYQAAVSDIPGDFVQDFGPISNLGEIVSLTKSGLVLDFADCRGGWFAGTVSPGYYSMERVNAAYSGNNPANWRNNNGIQTNGHDADGDPLNATARAMNSSYEPTPRTPVPTVSPITPTPSVTPFGYKTPPPTPAPPSVVINEVAWAGTAASYTHEWMELYNNTAAPVNLTGWRLLSTDASLDIALSGTIGANDYFLILRYATAISDIPPDLVAGFGSGLGNTGEYLQLKNAADEVIDELDCSGGWWGGDNTSKATMERKNPAALGNNIANWGTWLGPGWNGRDADGNSLKGTARAANSIKTLALFSLAGGDYDGDGAADLAVFRPSSGLWFIRSLTRFYLGGEGDVPVPGDYDGDGTDAPAVWRPASGLWFDADGAICYFGRAGDIPVPRDYDGDGTADPAVWRPWSGLWAVRDLTRVYLGSRGDIPVPGDYSGSGRAVPAVFRGGLWVGLGLRAYFGGSHDFPVLGDYDGDGIDDTAVFRGSAGAWLYPGGRRYLGNMGDFPVPADYDGSGEIEPGVFRSSTGKWSGGAEARSAEPAYFGKAGDIPVVR